jgi:hypothetical protein
MSKVSYTDIRGSIIIALLFWFTPIYIALIYVKTDLSLLNIVKIVLLFVGVFFAMLSQHLLHRLTGASSINLQVNPKHLVLSFVLALACALVLTVLTSPICYGYG